MNNNGLVVYTSDTERERRVCELRRAMSDVGISALVVAGRGDARFRGRTFYLSDILEISGDTFVVLDEGGDLTFITSPVVGLARASLTSWITDQRMTAFPGTEVGNVLLEHGHAASQIGLVGMDDAIAVAHLRQLRHAVPHASVIDATGLFESVRRVKSSEEIANLRDTSEAFRRLFADLEAAIKPGVTESDLLAEATYLGRRYGCKDVKAAFSKTPFRAVTYGTDSVIEPDDIVMIWIESPGSSGYWLELRRCYSFGRPPATVREFWNLQVEAAAAATAALIPGSRPSEVTHAVDRVMGKGGFECHHTNTTYSLHGIGTDAIEGFVFPDDDVILGENEVVSYHPAISFADQSQALELRFIGITDNVLITASGGERLTYASDVLVEL